MEEQTTTTTPSPTALVAESPAPAQEATSKPAFWGLPYNVDGEQPVSWDKPSVKPGRKHQLVLNGLMTSDLSKPSSTAPSTQSLLQDGMQKLSDEQYVGLNKQSFDDLASEENSPAVDPEYAASFFTKQVTFEATVFGGKSSTLFTRSRPANSEDGDRFQLRAVGKTFAAATLVPNTSEVAEIYAETGRRERYHEQLALTTTFKQRFAAAKTSDDFANLIVMLSKAHASYVKDKMKERADLTSQWLDQTHARRAELFGKAEVPIVAEGDAEEEEDYDGKVTEKPVPVDGEAAADTPVVVEDVDPAIAIPDDIDPPDAKPLATEEERTLEIKFRPTVVLAAWTVPIDFIDKDGELTLEPQNTKTLALWPVFERYGKLNKSKIVVPNKDFLPVSDWDTVPTGKKKVDPETGKETEEDETEEKEVTAYDKIADIRIRGSLQLLNISDVTSSAIWQTHKKTVVQVPCHMSGSPTEQELLVADFDRIRVLSLPLGNETDEEYLINPPGADKKKAAPPTNFKVISSSIDAHHICLVGLLPKSNTRIVAVISRQDMPQVTIFTASVPIATATLSTTSNRTLIVGCVDGTLIRTSRDGGFSTWEDDGRVRRFAYPPTKAKSDKLVAEVKALIEGGGRLPKDMAVAVEYDPDHVLHQGTLDTPQTIIEKHNRIVSIGKKGVYLFQLHYPVGSNERNVMMGLSQVAGIDFRGNIMAVNMLNNAFALINLFTFKIEVSIGVPTEIKPELPRHSLYGSSCVSFTESRIMFLYPEGSCRFLQFTDDTLIIKGRNSLSKSRIITPEERTASFLSNTVAAKTKTGKKKNGKKNKKKK